MIRYKWTQLFGFEPNHFSHRQWQHTIYPPVSYDPGLLSLTRDSKGTRKQEMQCVGPFNMKAQIQQSMQVDITQPGKVHTT